MKSSLNVGAPAGPETAIAVPASPAASAKARRIASLSAAAAVFVAVGASSALFVDYLADRALARTVEPVVVQPLKAKSGDPAAEPAVATLTAVPEIKPVAQAQPQPVQPEPAPIEAAMPDAAAIAKVAVGPGHAVELPSDDPDATPVLAYARPDNAGAQAVSAVVEDETITAAIAPDEPVAEPQPKKQQQTRPARQQAAPQAREQTEVASLPGVDVGGLAGTASADGDRFDTTVQTTTRQAATGARNLGGVPAGPARITAAVKLRSGPKKSSGVLGVVPAGSAVNVLSCNGWCQIDHGGQKGFVYKNFLAASQQRPVEAQQKPETAANAAPRPGQSPRER